MANAYRVTFFFESQQGAQIGTGAALGWSETWYKGNVDAQLPQEILNEEFDKYIELRTAFMPNLYRCSFVRLNDDENPRRFKIKGIGPTGLGKVDIEKEQAAQVQCAILIDLERMPRGDAEQAHHRRFLIRGLPAALVNGNVLRAAGAHWTAARQFMNFVGKVDVGLGANPGAGTFSYGIRYHNPAIHPVPIDVAIPDPNDPHQLAVKFAGMGAFEAGDKVIVRRIPSPVDFNKTWNVVGTQDIGAPPVTYLSLSRTREVLQGRYNGPGKGEIVKASYLYGTVDQYVLIGLRTKKTGRSFHLLRGRRSRR